MQLLKPGLKAQATLVVEESHTARHLRSGAVDALATPIMVALIEEAARTAVDQLLDPNQLSVGTALEITHQAATPVGMRVLAEAELVRIEERKLIFQVTARDEREVIGGGLHTRMIVNRERFVARFKQKSAGMM